MWDLNLKLAIDTALSMCAAAHQRALPTDPLAWSFSPTVVVSLAAAAGLYASGLYRLAGRELQSEMPDRWHIAAFVAGLAVVAIALCSPVETLSDNLFSMHMAQHILLMMVAPVLLVWSRPGPVFAQSVPPDWQARIGAAWRAAKLDRVAHLVMRPVSVFFLFCGTFVFWHLPLPYLLGLSYAAAHLLEHASFLFTALAFWTLIIEPSGNRRLDYAATLLFLVVTVVLSDMPGALMVISPRLLYPIHAGSVEAYGLTPMQDQQLAGLIMWIPAGAIYLGAAIWLFLKLLSESERRAVTRRRSLAARGLVALLILLLPLLTAPRAEAAQGVGGGDADRGAKLIGKYGCGSCHSIPGIDGAKGVVGPPLDRIGARVYIAGVLRNTPDNMLAWLRNPQRIVPGNAMPNLGIPEQQARDIAAYLYTLE